MNFLSLAWTINKNTGGNSKVFDWSAINEKLVCVLECSGTVTIDAEDDHESPRMLQIRAENGAYLITFGMETESGWTLKSYKNHDETFGEVKILGDVWSKSLICYKKELIMKIFKSFYFDEVFNVDLLDDNNL